MMLENVQFAEDEDYQSTSAEYIFKEVINSTMGSIYYVPVSRIHVVTWTISIIHQNKNLFQRNMIISTMELKTKKSNFQKWRCHMNNISNTHKESFVSKNKPNFVSKNSDYFQNEDFFKFPELTSHEQHQQSTQGKLLFFQRTSNTLFQRTAIISTMELNFLPQFPEVTLSQEQHQQSTQGKRCFKQQTKLQRTVIISTMELIFFPNFQNWRCRTNNVKLTDAD